MFETRADVMAMFEQFRSVDKADLGSNQSLENHALLVMNALDEAIANMDDSEYLIEMLLTTGKSHRRFEQFSTIIFWVSLTGSLDQRTIISFEISNSPYHTILSVFQLLFRNSGNNWMVNVSKHRKWHLWTHTNLTQKPLSKN